MPRVVGEGGSGPGGTGPTGIRANKDMVASVANVDGALACATPVAVTPATSSLAGGYVGVDVNGAAQIVGDGVKLGVDCYFSADGGVTARAMKAIVATDLLYWNPSVAGFPLGVTDLVDFSFEVTT